VTTRVHDYKTLEAEYIRSDISIRALCRKHGIKGFSSVAAFAREHEWDVKRGAIQARAVEKQVEKYSDQLVDETAEVRSEFLAVLRASVYRFAEQLKDPDFRISVDGLIKLMDKGLLLIGEPTSRTEEKHLGINISTEPVPADVLRDFLGEIRARRALDGAAGSALPSGPKTTGPH
jgi:hypothetical protein